MSGKPAIYSSSSSFFMDLLLWASNSKPICAKGKSVLSDEFKSQDLYLLLGNLVKLSDSFSFHFLIRLMGVDNVSLTRWLRD